MRDDSSRPAFAPEPMTDVSELITIAEAADLFPRRNGKKISLFTVKRWVVNGYRGIRLQGTKVGNQWFTSEVAVRQFQADCTAKATGLPEKQTEGMRESAAKARAWLEDFRNNIKGRRRAKSK